MPKHAYVCHTHHERLEVETQPDQHTIYRLQHPVDGVRTQCFLVAGMAQIGQGAEAKGHHAVFRRHHGRRVDETCDVKEE